jgi:hypothetical protein
MRILYKNLCVARKIQGDSSFTPRTINPIIVWEREIGTLASSFAMGLG